jgi:trehalose-6-phosphate synthase
LRRPCFVKAYTKVNELFANATVDALRKLDQKLHEEGKVPDAPPIVWVHDYQLMLAANTIR